MMVWPSRMNCDCYDWTDMDCSQTHPGNGFSVIELHCIILPPHFRPCFGGFRSLFERGSENVDSRSSHARPQQATSLALPKSASDLSSLFGDWRTRGGPSLREGGGGCGSMAHLLWGSVSVGQHFTSWERARFPSREIAGRGSCVCGG